MLNTILIGNNLLLLQKNTADDSHHIQIKPPDLCLSITNNNTEQIEPMDLSCVKISNSNVVKKTHYETNYLIIYMYSYNLNQYIHYNLHYNNKCNRSK
jgi:hypothetical protein